MRHVVIGVFGATIFNHNLGCQALSWSLFAFLEKISQTCGILFEYIVFDRSIHVDCNRKFEKEIGIEPSRLTYILGSTPKLYKLKQNKIFLSHIKECDLVIDITAGDSFSDIYGFKRFLTWTLEKWIVEVKKVPLLLGPQTYGPFLGDYNKKFAFHVINKAAQVMTRDNMSTDYISANSNCKVYTGIDVAFILPFHRSQTVSKNIINIDINPSGLLWNAGRSSAETLKLQYKADYRAFLTQVLDYLTHSSSFVVHLVPHVKNDSEVIEELGRLYPKAIRVQPFEDAIEAKSYISGLDFFMGSRMHATIAAFSSSVPVLPISYSRKFEGLYRSIKYDHVISMLEMSTEEAVTNTIAKLNNLETLKNDQKQALEIAQQKMDIMKSVIAEKILSIANKNIRKNG